MRLPYQIADVFYLVEDVPDLASSEAQDHIYGHVFDVNKMLTRALRLYAEGWSEDARDV